MEHVSRKIAFWYKKILILVDKKNIFLYWENRDILPITLPKREMVSHKITAHLWVFLLTSNEDTDAAFWIFL